MRKHPASFKFSGRLAELNEAAKVAVGETVLYEGSVRGICPLAPNNVNTMACAALAAHNLGFDGVVGCLIADTRSAWCLYSLLPPSLHNPKNDQNIFLIRPFCERRLEAHIVEIEATGPGTPPFTIKTVRYNPAAATAVTGNATYETFYSSVLRARGWGSGVHFC